MLYIRLCLDKPGMVELRERLRAEHRSYLANQPLRLVQAGPLCVDDSNDTNLGSFMIVEAANRDEVVRMHDNDPFSKAGLFAESIIHRWDKHIG